MIQSDKSSVFRPEPFTVIHSQTASSLNQLLCFLRFHVSPQVQHGKNPGNCRHTSCAKAHSHLFQRELIALLHPVRKHSVVFFQHGGISENTVFCSLGKSIRDDGVTSLNIHAFHYIGGFLSEYLKSDFSESHIIKQRLPGKIPEALRFLTFSILMIPHILDLNLQR